MKHIFLGLLAMISFSAVAQNNFKVPKYEKFKLKNGLTVYLMEQHEVPLINVSAVFDAGSIHDGERYGLASLTSDGLLFGTQKYTKPQIEELTDFVGASLSTYASKDNSGLTSSFAVKDQDKLFDIIQQVLLYPVFDVTEFNKHKQRTLLDLDQAKESPRSVIGNYFNTFVFKNFPYATPGGGIKSTVEKITADDAKAFYKSNYTTGKGAIAIVGDFKTADMKKRITGLFDGWKTAESRMIKRVAPDLTFDKSRVLLVNKDDARETTFLIGGKGVDYSSPDYVPIIVVNTILGGRFTSWLNDALRVNSGLTYGANSRFGRYKYAGTFAISTFTKNSTTVPAVDMALSVLDSLHKSGIDEKTLASAKAYVKGDFPPDYESAGALARLLTDMYVFNFDENYINTFQTKVDGLTTAQAKQIIADYFPKDKLQFIMVGKASEIRDQVKKYGEVTEKQIKAEGF
ncbi:M16 family metallopeptidase [Dyadobacter psychrotolerans]|uniref:Insulinase family protein n=1 Tax=Dyadobacter psychrotolerans TaxID=2541721 RepID=A0A4R5DV17_9BACT|nr:pitrilysin family protein [Dyadobacter psychrotolerans]TDE18299.1 insulinase family protein [Dyadobacter psychrotolerans]